MLRFVRAMGVRFLSDVTAVSDVTADFTNLFDGFVPPRGGPERCGSIGQPVPIIMRRRKGSSASHPAPRETLGRGPRADFVIDTSLLSRVHCRLEATETELTVEDLKSTNGTFVNGRRVSQVAPPEW